MVQDKKTHVEEFVPLQDFIVAHPVALDKGELKSDSGFVLEMKQNQSVVDRPTTGTVIAVGPDCEHVKVGYEIYWPNTDGLDLTFKNGDFMMFREKSIIGFKKPAEKE